MTRYVYIGLTPLTDHLFDNWYMNAVHQACGPVEYWYFQPRRLAGLVRDSEYQGLKVVGPFTKKQLARRICLTVGCVFVLLIEPSMRFYSVFRALRRSRAETVFLARGYLPTPSRDIVSMATKFRADPSKYLSIFFETIALRVVSKLGLVKGFDLVFCAGSRARELHLQTAARLVDVELFDVDLVEAHANRPRLIKTQYAVFVDQNLTGHPDAAVLGLPTLDAERYFTSINRFLRSLARARGLAIAVALHPTSESDRYDDQFRRFRGVTDILIRDSELVIFHFSTAVSFAILHSKPCVFITCNELSRCYGHSSERLVAAFAESLDSPFLNVDQVSIDCLDSVGTVKVNLGRYELYKQRYIGLRRREKSHSVDLIVGELRQLSGGIE